MEKVLLQVLVKDTFSILLEERTGKEHYLQQQMTKRGTHETVLSVFFGLKVASTLRANQTRNVQENVVA